METSLDDCKRMTCTGGGNILNYLEGTCEIRRCQGNDYMLSSTRGGWHIFVLDSARLTAENISIVPGNVISGQDGIGWIPIAVPIICVCVIVPIVVVAVVFTRRRKGRKNADEPVGYDNTVQRVDTQAAGNEREIQKPYYGLQSLDRSTPSDYESVQVPTYEQLE